MPTPFVTVPEALEEFARGRMIVVVDDEDRENEGDLTLAAEFVTPEAINFMATFGRGLICLTLTEDWADHMRLGPMAQENTSRFGTAFTQSIEAREGVTTGISAHDRAHTIRVAIDPDSTAQDLARPGHIFPLRARKGGVLVRAGQTEASVDLAKMAGLNPAGVICEIMKSDGTMARVPDLIAFCNEHGLKMLTVAELIRHRRQHERYVRRTSEERLPTAFADFRMIRFESEIDSRESHAALVLGDVADSQPVLVRVHRQCLRGDVFNSTSCNCRRFVDQSLYAIAQEGRGALVYLDNLGQGCHTEEAADPAGVLHSEGYGSEGTLRHVGIGGQILSDLGIQKIRLLTNTPTHIPALAGFGLEIVEFVPLLLDTQLHLSACKPPEDPWFTTVEAHALMRQSIDLL
ncbi:3,4-dihydroxy-2-butanone-4-phosphate synthase [Terriglobus saanensis]|uniref:3,4-dihydroxy-2-butanone 4-phosphate synthase n=1 Tax=Terriglobus saanensis (strain ATCC BAA-1853 / DSM 23119 / SP1PR4) TaxID=401053 RepID=E8V144_TERSS|nr:3,4-dihydroxy-2-butanone-4-phosphate synthase [Terriglobus saanensis]ADV83392.1 3,4-dihydroxy-2-butanone 4-phosphate synthase [Terriglobus saanensis SP1PR4]